MLELIWFVVIAVALIGEAVSPMLLSIWFAGGAVVALIAALCGAQLWLQIVLFLAVSAALLAVTRPLAKKYVTSRTQATNLDRIVGTEGRVTEAIDNSRGEGCVYVDGKSWTARSESGEPLPEGETVEILRIEGVKVIVRPRAAAEVK